MQILFCLFAGVLLGLAAASYAPLRYGPDFGASRHTGDYRPVPHADGITQRAAPQRFVQEPMLIRN